VAYKGEALIRKQSIAQQLGEPRLKELINFSLHYIADLDIPIKRGTFIEYRNGMINISPIGRACSQQERDEFFQYDNEHGVRNRFRVALEERFAQYGLQFAIGGQISIDCFPRGWDKTYCLQMLEEYPVIHFYGDRTKPVSEQVGRKRLRDSDQS
jgi:phosphomannomutase